MFGKKNKNKDNSTREPVIDAAGLIPEEENVDPSATEVSEVSEVTDAPEISEIPGNEEGEDAVPSEPVLEVIEEPQVTEPEPEEAPEVEVTPVADELIVPDKKDLKKERAEERAIIYSSIDDVDPDLLSDSASGEVTSRKEEKKKETTFVENPIEPVKLELDKSEDAKPSKVSKKTLAYVLVAIFAVVLIVGFLIFTEAGLKEKFKSPLSINNHSVASDEFSFMYHYILIENGVDVFAPDTKDMLYSECDDPNFKTNRDYFLDLTAKELQIMQLLYDDATKNGYEIEDRHYKMANSYIDWLQGRADELKVPLDTYIQGVFGTQVSKSCVIDTLAKKYFTEDYASDAKLVELQATKDQAKAAYEANRNTYDLVSYKSFRFVYEQRDKAFIDTANLHANQIIEAMGHDPAKLEESAAKVLNVDVPADSTLVPDARFADIEHADFRAWLFDLERTPGDTNIFTDEDGFPIVICFVERKAQETPLRNIKIFEVNTMPADENGENEFTLGDAQLLSQEIYDYITDEDSLDSVEHYYTDKVLDGIIKITASSDTYPGKFNNDLNTWIFSPDRKAGDKDIIESENGFYVIYFISESDSPEWYDRVNSFIRMNNYQAFLNEKLTEYSYEFKQSGLNQIVDVP
ncbi:MAG: hypothetical protein J6U54_15635 [Clostridiales bacterium]|nr:hypothetical protein [Clostridiales bacterium]